MIGRRQRAWRLCVYSLHLCSRALFQTLPDYAEMMIKLETAHADVNGRGLDGMHDHGAEGEQRMPPTLSHSARLTITAQPTPRTRAALTPHATLAHLQLLRLCKNSR